jgi:hypothetical protein
MMYVIFASLLWALVLALQLYLSDKRDKLHASQIEAVREENRALMEALMTDHNKPPLFHPKVDLVDSPGWFDMKKDE